MIMRREIKVLALIAVVIGVAVVFGSSYYRDSKQAERKSSTANSALVREDSASIGSADAKVTVVEFYDPECESCAAFNPTVKKIMKEYDGKARLVVRYMPLHPNSQLAAIFTESAGEQGKYWEAHDMLFEKQPEWGERHGAPSTAPKPDVKALFEKYAVELGIDPEKFHLAVADKRFSAKLDRDREDGRTLGVRQTPTFFVNGRQLAKLTGGDLRALIDDELKK
jgi:protein-disulfide isomerase